MNEGWQVPSYLQSPLLGNLEFNQPTTVSGVGECMFILAPGACQATRGMRATVDPVPQGDGEIFHRRFSNGVEFLIKLGLYITENVPACDADARLMAEALAGWLESIKNESGRYFWSPSDYGDDRMMDEARWLTPITETLEEGGIWWEQFTIDTPFPYVIDATQDRVALPDGVPTVVANDGNVDHFPVFIVDGPTTTFTIENQTTGLTIVYDASRPGAISIGGGDIAEIDTFRSTIYLGIGGEPGDDTNLKAGIDPLQTDYFTLQPGNNTILVSGAGADILVNNAWLP